MKKALVILLTLAVAGGLFAQTSSFTGSFEGGIGLLGGENFDKVVFGAVSPHMGVNGIRGNLEFRGTNADANAGYFARIRATGAQNQLRNTTTGAVTVASFRDSIILHEAYAWVKPFGDILEFRGGRYWDGVLATQTPLVDASLFDSTGLAAYLRPMDMITVGVGAYSPHLLNWGIDWENQGIGIWAALGVHLDILDARAHVSFMKDDIQALLGLRVSAIDIVPIWLQVRVWNLNKFGDEGALAAHLFFGVNMIDDVGINLGFGLGYSSVDDTDMSMAFGGWFNYTGLGNIVPRLDLWYVMGGNYRYNNGFAHSTPIHQDGWNLDTDDSYFNIKLMGEFRAASNMLWSLGGLVNILTGDNSGVEYGVFTSVRVTL